ncbi:sensor histidine kinase [Streptomyces sasae]|uniref:sensor histidine kinase n=1 Tax=Streptomyces sasae TaxID=1266772 RepID=UPI0029302B5A|nr:ATP-binding protein [Streptomyces sasae]
MIASTLSAYASTRWPARHRLRLPRLAMLRQGKQRPLRTRLSVLVTSLCALAMAATALAWGVSHQNVAIIVTTELAGLTMVATVSTTVVRRELSPLEHAADTADSIAAGDLGHRIPEAATAPATEVGRLAEALNGMLDQIQAALTAREASEERMRQFVADASHELRTPLQSLRGYAELYQHGALPDSAAVDAAMDRMLSEIHRMSRLVESLLMLARFDEEDEPELEPVDLSRIVADSCQDAAAVEPDRPRSIRIQDGVTVLGDAAQLRSLMANLLGNIRMHTPPGTPCSIELTAAPDAVTLRVGDQGPGIPKESQGHVFDRFYRADKGRSRSSGGTGLGLSIVAAIAELHHAYVNLDSAPGHGTMIEITLPPGR